MDSKHTPTMTKRDAKDRAIRRRTGQPSPTDVYLADKRRAAKPKRHRRRRDSNVQALPDAVVPAAAAMLAEHFRRRR